MVKRSGDVLDELTFEEMDSFVATDTNVPTRRPPGPDDLKLTADEVREALDDMPANLTAAKAREERIRRLAQALLCKREMTLVDRFARTALGPEPTTEKREAMQAALGHMYRLGGMFMETHVSRQRRAAPAQMARWTDKERRDQIIDAELRERPGEATKRLLTAVNSKLEQSGLGKASISHLYERRKILGQADEES